MASNSESVVKEMNSVSTSVGSAEDINPIGRRWREMQHLTTSHGSPPPNLPSGALLENRDDYHNICVPLFNASILGDLKAAQAILHRHQDLHLVRFAITENYDTALHIAVSTKSTRSTEAFVEFLVDKMSKEQLELQNRSYNTAFCLTAASGNVKIAKIMLGKNRALLDICGSQGMMPLYMASLLGNHMMVKCLYENSQRMGGDYWTDQMRGWVLQKCVEADMFDVAVMLVTDRPELAVNGSVLGVLAKKPYPFEVIEITISDICLRLIFLVIGIKDGLAEQRNYARQLLRIIWKNIVKLPKATIDEIIRGPADIIKGPSDVITMEDGKKKAKHSSRVLFVAAESGNTDFLVELIREYPDLLWKTNDYNQTIFHVAISHRNAGVFNLLYEIGSMKDMITAVKDVEGNNMLHLAGKRAKLSPFADVSGVPHMQRELLWFKEIENMIPVSYKEGRNNDGLTPYELFMGEHKDMLSANEKLLKETANQCMVAAALIASIGFASAMTVPGGYNQNNGIPMFLHNRSFIIFVISVAISLTFSSISILIFISIFMSRYGALDFLEIIPKKLMSGLATLSISITAMLVGFTASFFLFYKDNLIWVPILISVFISIPVILYARIPYNLMDVFRSTYGSRYLFRPKKSTLYYRNPNH